MGGLDRLWAGWRSDYIESVTSDQKAAGGDCVFCRILDSGQPDDETHIVWRHPAGSAFAILNAFPYGSGHILVMPVRHLASPELLDPAESVDVWSAVTDAVRAVRIAYRPDGVNVGANLGEAAGAGVPGHFHVHVLPRWSGDTNFMTSVAETRVLPEPLATSARKIRAAWSDSSRT